MAALCELAGTTMEIGDELCGGESVQFMHFKWEQWWRHEIRAAVEAEGITRWRWRCSSICLMERSGVEVGAGVISQRCDDDHISWHGKISDG
ncbi:hypothetical protein U1Q18_008131 [Sarracenia purpurea var. burkii]